MSSTLEYKGYLGSVEFSAEDNCLYGKIEFITDLIMFEGQSVAQIRTAFEDAVDSYIEFCKSQGKEPDQPFKGSFNVRVGEMLHRHAAVAAKRTGVTLNDYIKQALEEKLGHKPPARLAQQFDERLAVLK
jgi:predicted HicB family RNase H-like nuclease